MLSSPFKATKRAKTPAHRNKATAVRFFQRFQRDKTGVTAIEFGAVGIPFFMLIFGLIEFGLAFFVNQILDNATLESARLLRTGQAENFSKDQFKAELCKRLSVLCVESRIDIDVRVLPNFAALNNPDNLPDMTDADGKSTGNSSFSAGKPSSIMVVRVLYRWPMFTAFTRMDAGDTGGTERLLYSTAVFRNEPYIVGGS